MTFVLGVILLVVAGSYVEASSMNDFVSSTSTFCPRVYSCQQRNNSVDFLGICECHDDCVKYSTCCYDADAYEKTNMKRSLERSRCIYESRMIVKCSDRWKDGEIQELCERASPLSFSQSKEPLLHLPVRSKKTNTTYPNYYCAICNYDAEEITVWEYLFGCSFPSWLGVDIKDKKSIELVKKNILSELEKVSDTGAVENCSDCSVRSGLMTTKNIISTNLNITFSGEGQGWIVSTMFNSKEIHLTCGPMILESLVKAPREACMEEIDTCAEHWNDREIEDLCKSFEGLIERNNKDYRNVFCAVCNNVYIDDPCNITFSAAKGEPYSPLSILYRIPDIKNQHLNSKCKADEDVFPGFCSEGNSSILCQLSEDRYRDGICIKRDNSSNSSFSDPGRNNQMMAGKNSTNDEVHFHKTLSDRGLNKYKYTNETQGDAFSKVTQRIEKSSVLSWVTLSLMSLSVVCLLFHLVISVLSKELRSLPGRNLASLCLSLLLSYITFITGPFLESKTTACYVSASVMYFSWMSSFCWMSVIAFDTWWCFEKTAQDFHRAQGSRWFRFLLYSISSWLTSAVALAVLITIDCIQPEGIDISLLPKLGQGICWFGGNDSLQVFFVYPVITFVLIITLLFLRTVWVISKSSHKNGNVSENCARRNLFKINLRLAAIMGIPWTTYIISWYFGTTFLEYVFVIMNSLQGTFIFFAFSCKRERWTSLLEKCQAGLNNVRKKDIQLTTLTLETEDEQL
ncbi:uncharacterized protein [Macrobrachium rosenbergii]|uniref:uncharacterized protein n=1 Tax=Macrobrachium rosenbergii TaxID=79674 RepID=UPI0034D4CD56